ncbi:hypothetical protein G9C85_05840 [Halorubellus sp. JP-L1]|uniref:hypothetical protein n=1 Tax=Halorubellus sp. JP-L1 TaxID=2715753 RepID=UPI0014092E79|nr:hypothetical protein [Halorubellus sp. JP-L1]NHN41157.1 hypothetical protein [Halorubellus sp. JP-L1]
MESRHSQAAALFATTADVQTDMARHDFGWFGWFSAAGFFILGTLYLLDLAFVEVWPYSATWTLVVALLAGIGALALYYGNDPTGDEEEHTRDTTP